MTVDAILAAACKLVTLEDLVRAAPALGLALVEVVAQDEYTHDVVMTAAPAWLVFDTT